MSNRTRLALLILVLVAFVAARAGGALGSSSHRERASARDAKVVTYARRLLGVRYAYGGASPQSGFDCSGFTRFVFAHFGIGLPHYSAGQFNVGRRVARRALRPGDLVFFDGLGHVGIYLGRGRFIHAPHSGATVSVDLIDGWYSSRFTGARRLL